MTSSALIPSTPPRRSPRLHRAEHASRCASSTTLMTRTNCSNLQHPEAIDHIALHWTHCSVEVEVVVVAVAARQVSLDPAPQTSVQPIDRSRPTGWDCRRLSMTIHLLLREDQPQVSSSLLLLLLLPLLFGLRICHLLLPPPPPPLRFQAEKALPPGSLTTGSPPG